MERRDKKLEIKRAVVTQRQPRGARERDGHRKVCGQGAGSTPQWLEFLDKGNRAHRKAGMGNSQQPCAGA